MRGFGRLCLWSQRFCATAATTACRAHFITHTLQSTPTSTGTFTSRTTPRTLAYLGGNLLSPFKVPGQEKLYSVRACGFNVSGVRKETNSSLGIRDDRFLPASPSIIIYKLSGPGIPNTLPGCPSLTPPATTMRTWRSRLVHRSMRLRSSTGNLVSEAF